MRAGWEQFRIALGFLTILPVSRSLEMTPQRLGRSMALFPAVGLAMGLCLVLINWALQGLLPRPVLDCLLLLLLIVATGGLHLDGIADLLDGLAGGRDREGILHIMKDSRVGAMGVIGLVMLLLLKYLCLFNLPLVDKSAALILMPATGRLIQVVLAVSCRYLRGEEGTGAVFVEYAGEQELLLASGTVLLAAVVLFGLPGVFLVFLLGVATIVLIKYFEARLGGVTGDVLGAASELVEVLTLLLILAIF
jgi:adenosylcobinamide-GDP ribazoletransferase